MRTLPRKLGRPKERAVPDVRRPVATEAGRAEAQSVPPPAGIRHAHASEAVEKMIRHTLAKREGLRLLVLGNSRRGKSTFMNFLNSMLTAHVAAVFVHDAKYQVPQYRYDFKVGSLDELTPEHGGVIEVFDRPMRTTPNDIARLVCDLGLQGTMTVCEVDEVMSVMGDGGGRAFEGGESSPLAFLYKQGGGMGASVVVLAQLPQNVPVTILTLSDWVVMFQLRSKALGYVERDCELDDDAMRTAAALEPGQFILHERGGDDWDRTVYTVPREFIVNR